MAKLALCMKAVNAPDVVREVRESNLSRAFPHSDVIRTILSQSDISMEDRATCETDPSLLQFIPYITVRNSKGKIFNYSRGTGSEEARLHAKLSVGLGGHVDSLPPAGVSLYEHLTNEAVRELKEEIGIDVNPRKLILQAVLVNAETPVDQVHIGLSFTYTMEDTQDIVAEAKVIEKGGFAEKSELLQEETFSRMENWSKLVLGLGR